LKPNSRASRISRSVSERLDAVHGFLHQRVEVLDAEAAAVEADVARSRSVSRLIVRGSSSIEYSRPGCFDSFEVAAELLHQAVDLERGEEGGVPPPKCSCSTSRSWSYSWPAARSRVQR